MKYALIAIGVLILAFNSYAQTSIDNILATIQKNNKNILANTQYWEAKKLEYKTGLTLPNPSLQAQYLFGSPVGAGNQTDFFAVQPFDHPTSYKKRRELANLQGDMSLSKIMALRQDVLLEGKLVCIELVYRHKLRAYYAQHKARLDKLLQDFQTKLAKGDAIILDVNKTKLQLLENQQLQQSNAVDLQKLQTRLTELNAGQALVFTDTLYPPSLLLAQSFEQIEKEYESIDPLRQSLEHEKRIAEKQLELAKLWRLPKFEAGYHYQSILGQRFNGLHAGVTLPLWEQKFRKESLTAQTLYADISLQAHANTHFFEIKTLYDRQASLQKTLTDYQTAISGVSNTTLLDKALALGQITTIEYFYEINFYQNALLSYLKTEWEYQAVVAELMKYRL